MSSAADALRLFLAPLLPGWRQQFGGWVDGNKDDTYCVIKPAGGLPAELVRRPGFTIFFIGAANQPAQIPYEAANAVIEAMRTASIAGLVYAAASEPIPMPTSDGRAVFEIAVSAITN